MPPPAVCGLADASVPMTAIDLSKDPSGSAPPLFFKFGQERSLAPFWSMDSSDLGRSAMTRRRDSTRANRVPDISQAQPDP
jgi:hypothetical protein